MNKERYFVWKNYEALEELVEGGGPSTATIVEKSITENGTYNASSDEADGYNPVIVNVANSYAAGDEGKVVDNGALVAQTSTTKTANGTYNTTTNNEVVIEVANSYTAGDEGKVVDNGALVSQTNYGTVTENGTYNTTTNNSVTVNVSSGPVSMPEKDVNFYDYDGTCVYAYTKDEFLALSEMPANPDRTSEGLTAQGWNWTYQEAIDYVTYAGVLEVGQVYIPTDGATKIYCSLMNKNINLYLGFCLNGTATIDWGDNSATETVTGTSTSTTIYTPHTYTSNGDYVISINVANGGSIAFIGDSTTATSSVLRWSSTPNTNDTGVGSTITKIHFGNYVTLGTYALASCYSLKTITLPQESSRKNLGQRFINYTSIEFLIIPTFVGFESLAFYNNNTLKHIVLHGKLDVISYRCFEACSNLDRIILPYSIDTISVQAFQNAYNLKYIIAYCGNLTDYNQQSYLGLSGRYCKKLVLSPTVTSIYGSSLSVSLFSYLQITELDIPQSVTSIGNAFMNCYSLASIKFHSTTPPTLNANTFTNLPMNCIIYVPTGTLTAYTTASNYPDPNTYTYVEY